MDNLTHTLVGLMMARAGLEKTAVRGAGMLMLAANIPDIDAVTWFGGTTVYLESHRGITHTLLFMPVIALVPMLMVRAKFSWRAWIASMLGVLSHVLLDWSNSFGIPLLMPFSMRRWRLDTVNIVDIWLWLILLGALAAAALVKMVNREIGEKNQTSARRGWAWAALIALLAFEGLRLTTHSRAVSTIEARLYDGAPARRATALPNAINPFTWRGIAEAKQFIYMIPVDVAPLNLAHPFDPSAGKRYKVIDHSAAMDAALATRPFQVFSRFSQMPYWQVSEGATGTQVSLMDLRFGDPGNLGFGGVTAVVDRDGRVEFPR